MENYKPEANPNSPDSVRLTDIVQTFNTNTGLQFSTRWSNIVDLISPEVEPEWGNVTGTIGNQTDLVEYLVLNYQSKDSDLTSWAGVTRASGFDTFTATPSSANLRSLLTDETGTGVAVFGTSPTFTTKITVNGGILLPIVTKTTTYTATVSDYTILCDATGGGFTVTLPAATSFSGGILCIKKIDATGNTVTIDGNASETIDGATTQSLDVTQEAITIQSSGTNWFIISSYG